MISEGQSTAGRKIFFPDTSMCFSDIVKFIKNLASSLYPVISTLRVYVPVSSGKQIYFPSSFKYPLKYQSPFQVPISLSRPSLAAEKDTDIATSKAIKNADDNAIFLGDN
mmetsp:Transcript_34597/g.57969  ORF Transcript_34597/g.57969 Transcript_34597/m.57969 type:complete len:110 (+) Transcript_34597:549-878(+)